MPNMTDLQAYALAHIRALYAGECKALASLYTPSGIMAHIQIESAWEPAVHSSDGLGSIGLMQVLPATARGVGVTGDQSDPAVSILAGMLYLVSCQTYLGRHIARPLRVTDVVAAYNEGPGNVLRGRTDPQYVERWTAAQKLWAWVDDLPEVQPPPSPTPSAASRPATTGDPASTPAVVGGLVSRDTAVKIAAANEAPSKPAEHVEDDPEGSEPDDEHTDASDEEAQELDAEELSQLNKE